MKAVAALCVLLASFSASAQNIECKEVLKSGKARKNGGALSIDLVSQTVAASGWTRDKSDTRFDAFEIRSVNESKPESKFEFATLFLTPVQDDGMLDIQLQFGQKIVAKNLKDVKAVFVIGSEDANPDSGFAFGFDVICSSK